MDFEFESRWKKVLSHLEEKFGEEIDLEAILFLIGIQELGRGPGRFSKDEKLNLIHIGICTVLEPYGYYAFQHFDEEGWPHFRLLKKLPHLNDKEQKELMRKAIVGYFEERGLSLI
jgi:hypothetical protein